MHDGEVREEVVRHNDEMAREGLRVLACAYRDIPQGMQEFRMEDVERDLVFLGLAGMMDPPRPEVADAVKMARNAGSSFWVRSRGRAQRSASCSCCCMAAGIGVPCCQRQTSCTGTPSP